VQLHDLRVLARKKACKQEIRGARATQTHVAALENHRVGHSVPARDALDLVGVLLNGRVQYTGRKKKKEQFIVHEGATQLFFGQGRENDRGSRHAPKRMS
jgi:hypothetical protein